VQNFVSGSDRSVVTVLRRADIRVGLVYGRKRRHLPQEAGGSRQDGHLHDPPAVLTSLQHVRQVSRLAFIKLSTQLK